MLVPPFQLIVALADTDRPGFFLERLEDRTRRVGVGPLGEVVVQVQAVGTARRGG